MAHQYPNCSGIPTTYKPDQIPFMKHQLNALIHTGFQDSEQAALCPLTSPTPTIPQTNSIHLRLLHSRTNRRLLSRYLRTEPGPDNSALQALQLCMEKGSMEGVPWGKHDKRPLKQSLLHGVGAAIAPVTAPVAR